MQIIKYLSIAIILIISAGLILGLFISKELKYEKTIVINAPIDSVWENVNSLAALDRWSPWNELDRDMKKEYSGTDGTVGASVSWDSDVKDVGKGTQTITNIEKPALFETNLVLYMPRENEAKGYIKLAEEGSSTNVTWGFVGEMPYPFNVMKLIWDMDKMMETEWNNGLSKLKELCED